MEVQQHCSWLNHMALRHTPSFRSFIQSATMSIRPAKAPGRRRRTRKEKRGEKVKAGRREEIEKETQRKLAC